MTSTPLCGRGSLCPTPTGCTGVLKVVGVSSEEAAVRESDVSPGVWGETDDIERELYCSSREASVGWVPFVDCDFASMMRRVADLRIEREQLMNQEVMHLHRFGYPERLFGARPSCHAGRTSRAIPRREPATTDSA